MKKLSLSSRIILFISLFAILLLSFFTVFSQKKYKVHGATNIATTYTFVSNEQFLPLYIGSNFVSRWFSFRFEYPYISGVSTLYVDIDTSDNVMQFFDILVSYDYVDLTDPSYPTLTETVKYYNTTDVIVPFSYDDSNVVITFYPEGYFDNPLIPDLNNVNFVVRAELLGDIPTFLETENNLIERIVYSSDSNYNYISYLTATNNGLRFTFKNLSGFRGFENYTLFISQLVGNEIYDRGYLDGERFGFNSGYNQGYDLGYTEGLSQGTDYNFLSLMSAVVDAPITAVRGLLSFDILGVNLYGLFSAVITVALFIFVIRLFL